MSAAGRSRQRHIRIRDVNVTRDEPKGQWNHHGKLSSSGGRTEYCLREDAKDNPIHKRLAVAPDVEWGVRENYNYNRRDSDLHKTYEFNKRLDEVGTIKFLDVIWSK